MKQTFAIHKFARLVFASAALIIASLPLGPAVLAISGSDFQAGNIISGAVFTNYNAMGVDDIQNFLNSKVPSCDTGGVQLSSHWNAAANRYYSRAEWGQAYDTSYNTNVAATPYVCLKNYVENPATKQNNLLNPSLSIPGGKSAAQIIYDTAQAYKINPEVLIVTLQKEQGLVTDDWPWTNAYSAAMGYGCPDDGTGCHGQYAGFATQLDNAGWQYRDYLNNPNHYNFSTGNNFVLYNTTGSGCASNGSIVNIQNLSTAALYDYTPYQPDSSVLASTASTAGNGAGAASGDNCAAYGNRNFWWYFNKWFGSTQTTTSYAWNFYSESVYADSSYTQNYATGNDGVIALTPGSKAYIRLRALNNGNQVWNNSNLRLGTSSPRDRCSLFSSSSWISCGRIQLTESTVSPGDVGTFNFAVTAPNQVGSYREYFNLVDDGVTWLNDPLFFIPIDVVTTRPPTNTQSLGLNNGQTLLPGQTLLSPDSQTSLLLQADGNLVLYSDFVATWSSHTSGNNPSKLIMQGDGNLVLYNTSNQAIWASNTTGTNVTRLSMQTDGSMVVLGASNQTMWTSGTATNPNHLSHVDHTVPSDSFMVPGQMLGTAYGSKQLVFQRDGNLVMYSAGKAIWASNTDQQPANVVRMQSDGNLVIYSTSGKAIWSSKTGGTHASLLRLQDDGNLVIYDGQRAVWATSTYNM